MEHRRGLLERWGQFAVRRRWFIIASWVLAAIALAVIARNISRGTVNSLELPGAESQQAVELLQRSLPERSGDYADVVIATAAGIDAPEVRARVESLAQDLAAVPGVVAILSPYALPGAIVSPDRTTAILRVQFASAADDVSDEGAQALERAVQNARAATLQVELGGPVAAALEREGPNESTVLGVAAALLVLYILFRALVPAALPVASAMSGLATGFAVIFAMTAVVDLSKFAPNIAAMLGLGVGIDYALFIVARYREAATSGREPAEAVGIALTTAGRSVVFAGGVVITSLLGLGLMGIPFVGWIGLASAAMVAVAVLAALTLLPALLGVAGRRMRSRRRRSSGAVMELAAADHDSSSWYRFGHAIMRRPYMFLVLSTLILVVLTVPLVDMRLGSADAGNNPPGSTTRRAYDLVASAFGAGMNGPLQLVLDGAATEEASRVVAAVAADPDVQSVSTAPGGTSDAVTLVSVVPASPPQSAETAALVHRLRDEVLPAAVAGTSADAYVGGATARAIDIADRIAERLPIFFTLVIGISFLLLVAVFRSVLIPVKAALMNLLSIGAAYGFVVAVFQWGWGGRLIGVDQPGPIESFLPMMLFAVLFGLSMDYEVFLVGRIREEYLYSHDNARSVARGLAATAGVITAAAAIMIAVFLSFVLNDQRVVKEFGLGLAVAVLVDATIVRLMLVPATMELMGEWNWWLPRFLERVVPRISLEGAEREGHGDAPLREVSGAREGSQR